MIKNIGLISDSIGHGFFDETDLGWFSRLGKLILSKHDGDYVFNNMSYSGDNIADATNRSFFEASTRQFDLIIISIGINDLRRRKDSNLQLDFSEGARIMYWNKLLDKLSTTLGSVIVTDLIPVIENRYSEQASLVRRNSDVERYNEIIKNICEQKNILFFSRYDQWINRNLKELYKDATHPNANGHQIMAEEIYEYLQKKQII